MAESVATIFAEVRLRLDALERDLATLRGRLASAGETMSSSLGRSMERTGKALTLGLTAPLVAVGKASLDAAGKFSQTLEVMRTQAGLSGKDMERLRALALRWGADTVFSAQEAADAMLEMTKAGVPVEAIMKGAGRAVLDLAAATGVSLPQAANHASVMLNTFGAAALANGKAVEFLKEANDSLARAANASIADFQDLVEAFEAGASAWQATFGIGTKSLNEFNVALAMMHQAGVRGAEAGTTIKTALMKLWNPAAKTKDMLQEVFGSKAPFVDAAGRFKPLEEIAEILHRKLATLTDDQMKLLAGLSDTELASMSFEELQHRLGATGEQLKTLTVLAQVFGTRGVRFAIPLVREGAAGVQKMREAMEKSAGASALAQARMKGWAGSVEQLRGSWETLRIAIGEALARTLGPVLDTLTKAVNKLMEHPERLKGMFSGLAAGVKIFVDMIRVLASLPGPVQKVIATLVGFGAAAGPVLIILGKLARSLKDIREATGIARVAGDLTRTTQAAGGLAGVLSRVQGILGGMTGLTNPWILALVGVAAVAVLVIKHWDKVKDFFVGLGHFIASHWRTVVGVLTAIITGPMGLIIGWIVRNWSKVKDFFVGLWSDIVSKTKAFVGDVVDWVKRRFGDLVNFFEEMVKKIGSFFSHLAFWRHSPSEMEVMAETATRNVLRIFERFTAALAALRAPRPAQLASLAFPTLGVPAASAQTAGGGAVIISGPLVSLSGAQFQVRSEEDIRRISTALTDDVMRALRAAGRMVRR